MIKAENSQVDRIFGLLTACRLDMDRQGIYQWTIQYPLRDMVVEDIENGQLYLAMSGDHIKGVITIDEQQDEEYRSIEWQSDEEPILIVHRLAIDPRYQRQGLARKLMDFAEEYAVSNGYRSIRLDAYSGNPRILKLYIARGYNKVGEIFFPYRSLPFYCFEKIF